MGASSLERNIPIDRALLLNLRGQWSPNMPFYGSKTREEKLTDLFRLRRQSGTENTSFESENPFERLMSGVLRDMHVIHEHEPFTVTMNDRKTGIRLHYQPDFVTDIKIRHRRVVIETKGIGHFNREKLERVGSFAESFGREYYYVVVVNATMDAFMEKIEHLRRKPLYINGRKFRPQELRVGKIADEIWPIVTDSPEERRQKHKPKPWDEEFFTGEEPRKILEEKVRALTLKGTPIIYDPGIA